MGRQWPEGSGHETASLRPFLRWVGGKQQLVNRLLALLPDNVLKMPYREPFLGAGSLYLALRPAVAHISDSNAHLVNCYRQIRANPTTVARLLRAHARKSSEAYYYAVRSDYVRCPPNTPTQAARFIYLNRTCFNGVFRVNRKGQFNVPYGRKEPPRVPDRAYIESLANVLEGADLMAVDFTNALAACESGDFVYLDPPYPPLNGTAYFTHYTRDRFSWEDQRTLADYVRVLDGRGCLFMMSNADTKDIRGLYSQFRIANVEVTRYVTCKKRRHRVGEVVITNYRTPDLGGET